MIKEILEYQKLDEKLVEVEKKFSNSPAKVAANKMVAYVKQAQQNLIVLEQNATKLIENFEKLNQQYQKTVKDVDNLSKQKLENLSVDELRENANAATQLNSNLLTIERNISLLSERIASILKDFEKTKDQVKSAKTKFEQNKAEHVKFVESHQATIQKLQKELASVEKTVNKDILKRYKELRSDNKFPIFVPLTNDSCGGCSMQQPRARLDKLKADKMLECENCHRMIYLPEDQNK